jgi:AcrR family transcriptional regulator
MTSRLRAQSQVDVGPSLSTKERILREASQLIAQQGYHATTTRQIAERVGVRQPSLFHHFESKAEIVAELLEWDLGQTLPFVEALVKDESNAAVRLYTYLLFDADHLMNAPYNLAGVFTEDVMGDPAFTRWALRRKQVHVCVSRIVEDGVRSGDFLDVSPQVISEAVAGVLIGVLTFHSGGRTMRPKLGDEIAALLVRGVLSDPARLHEIRSASSEWLRENVR